MGKTIFEIRNEVNKFPFAIKQIGWPNNLYLVVFSDASRNVHNKPRGTTFLGIPFRDGYPIRIYEAYENGQNKFIIPLSEIPNWEVKADVDLKKFESRNIHSLDSYLTVGQYICYTLLDVLFFDPSYIDYCLRMVSSYCLDEEAMSFALEIAKDKLSPNALEHNKQKLLYYQNIGDSEKIIEGLKNISVFQYIKDPDAKLIVDEAITLYTQKNEMQSEKSNNDEDSKMNEKQSVGSNINQEYRNNRIIMSSRMNYLTEPDDMPF